LSDYALPALVGGNTDMAAFAFFNKPYQLADLAKALRSKV